ncbi:MAG: helix-turn-helix domain-containing protein, partial [Streptococcus gallolyticus]
GAVVTKILPDAFRGNQYLLSVTLPDTVRSIGERAFYSCHNLIAVNLSLFLLDQAEKDASGTLVLDTVFTYQEIACYLGVHAVTIARMVKALRDEQLIDKIGHQIRIINPEQMARLITEERKIDY